MPVEPDSDVLEAAEAMVNEVPESEGLEVAGGGEDLATGSPFALTEEHEFPEASDLPTAPDAATPATPLVIAQPGPAAAPPPLPGTPLSPFRRCSCVGVLPGRVCIFCYGTKWTKSCPRCAGEGRQHLAVRKGATERSQPCGFCSGRGVLSAGVTEVAEAEKVAREGLEKAKPDDPASASQAVSAASAEPRRAPRFPGIGSTTYKQQPSLGRKQREGKRNEVRKAGQKAGTMR